MATTILSPGRNALDSLRRMERALVSEAGAAGKEWKPVLVWAWQAVALLFHMRIYPHRAEFDDWVQDYFKGWSPGAGRESVSSQMRLSLIQIIDLMSETELPSLQPEFYQGWRDKVARCTELRGRVHRVINGTIPGAFRDELIYLVELYQELLSSPLPVSIDSTRTERAIEPLLTLLENLIESDWPEALEMRKVVHSCRSSVGAS